MSKMKYIEPNVEVMVVSTKALMGDPLLGSGTAPEPTTPDPSQIIP